MNIIFFDKTKFFNKSYLAGDYILAKNLLKNKRTTHNGNLERNYKHGC